MGDEFNLKNNEGQINIAKDNSTINAEQNNVSNQKNNLEEIKTLIAELIKNIPEDNSINDENKEKIKKAINTTNKQLDNDDKDMLEACVNNLENINKGIGAGTKIFKGVVFLVGLIRTTFGI
jgi:molecular chaperone DnaK (HSP70)